jgi:hypothetical protein
MMTTAAKIEANRRNARRSTGPRTKEGKEKVRFNAVKHGLRAETVVLPHEDEDAYRQRVDSWTRELNPRGDLGRYLAERAAKISWQLDRADGYEQACLARRVRTAERTLEDGGGREAAALLERLYQADDEPPSSGPKVSSHFAWLPEGRGGAPAEEYEAPEALLRRLEGTAGGCRKLMAEWGRLRDKAVAPPAGAPPGPAWDLDDMSHAIRLMGLKAVLLPAATVLDGRLTVLAKVHHHVQGEFFRRLMDAADPDELSADVPEEHPEKPFPFDPAEVARGLRAIAEDQLAKLEPKLARFEEDEAEAGVDLPLRSSFDDSAEGERLHRYQMHWSRSLLRTLASIENLRDAPEAEPITATPADAMPPSLPSPPPRPAPEDASPAEAPVMPIAENAISPNKPTAEETTSRGAEVCVKNPDSSKATAAVAGTSPDARLMAPKASHAQRDLRQRSRSRPPGDGDETS